mmetsp:Transcript_7807/g.14014  ORF Transcript_7807/g.14014 Transcript_7807/m.14014 type:complete len:207 (+) Transcript_7807:1169-1789(+)
MATLEREGPTSATKPSRFASNTASIATSGTKPEFSTNASMRKPAGRLPACGTTTLLRSLTCCTASKLTAKRRAQKSQLVLLPTSVQTGNSKITVYWQLADSCWPSWVFDVIPTGQSSALKFPRVKMLRAADRVGNATTSTAKKRRRLGIAFAVGTPLASCEQGAPALILAASYPAVKHIQTKLMYRGNRFRKQGTRRSDLTQNSEN